MASLIEPSSFDLIVLGTGLPQCIVAAAAARSGHSVLHLDTCDFYGSHWASLPLQDFSDWCQSAGQLPFPSSSQAPSSFHMHDDAIASVDSSETSKNLGMEASVQNERDGLVMANETIQNETEILDMDSIDVGVGESACASQTSTLGLEEDNTQAQGGDLLHAPDADGTCSSSEASQPTDATVAQKFASNGNDLSLPATSMEEMGLDPVLVEAGICMYRSFQFLQGSMDGLGQSRSYCIDIAGPKLAYCGGPLVDLLLRSGASNYLEFKDLESTFMWGMEGLSPVPSSRADVFKDRTLSNAEKRHLMRFFKLVVDHASLNLDASQISQEDLESPFAEFLKGRQVPSSVQAYKSK